MATVDHRRDELQRSIQRQLDELKELEENAQRDAAAAEAPQPQEGETAPAPVPEPADPATLTAEERQALAKLQEIEQAGREALDRKFPTAWNPSKNRDHPDEIPAALILRIDPHVGPSATYGTFSAVLEVRDGQGREWAIWCNKPDSALWNTLLRLRLQPGEVIAVRDNGTRPSQRDPKRTVHDVRMVRVGDTTGAETVDYDKLDRAPGVTAQPSPDGPAPDDDIPF